MNELPAEASAEEQASQVPDRRLHRGKAFAGLFSVLLIVATLAPVAENWRSEPKDSFPLSYYPMFSAKRGETYQVNYIVGLDAKGNRHLIPHKFAGTGGGFNQTRRQINRYVDEKRGDELARSIAAALAREKKPPYSEIVTVRIVRGRFRFDDYFHGNKTPISESVRGSARVKRGAS
jgi:hypothetical protein